ncbi:MAG: phospholipid transport system substrate-binding protein [Cellvibrionaceae bacterium]|jgi:phospholipid transport system substrate-binding protein
MVKKLSVIELKLFVVLMVCFFATSAGAVVKVLDVSFDSEPHKVIHVTTLKVLSAIEGGLDPIKEPERFVEQLSSILDPVVAFGYIARGVMGNYAKQVTPDQAKQFSSAFKSGLVNTYGKGMSNFSDLEVVVLPPTQSIGAGKKTTVVQEIRGISSTNQVSYSMAKNNKGEWKMVNVVLNGINLGQTFRGQFAAEVEKNKGDVVKTINEWGKN